MKKLITPFENLSSMERTLSTIFICIGILLFWSISQGEYIPPPLEIIKAFPKLVVDRDVIGNFIKSMTFCLKAISFSAIISLFICYLSVLPIFQAFCQFLRKFRFLPSTGLAFLFMKMAPDIQHQMLWMMIFGITTWLIDSMVSIALSINSEEIMYAKSLRLNPWQQMLEILIKGKAADIYQAIISNFGMAWMLLAAIENIAKASGGIGVILAESNKYYKFDQVYAIQILILLTGISIDYALGKTKYILFPYSKL